MVSDNAHVFALHRSTGQLIWDVEMADSKQNYGSTSAPLVVNDLVVAGVSGGDEGVRGFLDGYKAATGERVWRFWTIPAPANRARKRGPAAPSNTAAALPGSRAHTIPKRGSSIGRPATHAPITTATSAKAITCTPRRWWRWTRRTEN